MPASDLVGHVALVIGGGEAIGAAVARSLSARGVAVVVFGADEHALARVVGEIAASGGKARHLQGDVASVSDLEAAVAKANSTFGAPVIVVSAAENSEAGALERSFRIAVEKVSGARRCIAITSRRDEIESLAPLSAELAARHITCNAISPGAVAPEDVAEVAAFFCTRAAGCITGQTVALSPENKFISASKSRASLSKYRSG